MKDWINPTPDELCEVFGDWQRTPRVYLSGNLAGDGRSSVNELHQKIAALLAPDFLALSPLRGYRSTERPFKPDKLFYGGWHDRECRQRDLNDLKRSVAVLLDMRATFKKNLVCTTPNGQTYLIDDLTLRNHLPEGNTVITEVDVPQPLTGTVIEVYEAATKYGIPVIGYNSKQAARQTESIWMEPCLTRTFWEYPAAVAWIKSQLIL
jgi:hypothetical protein